VASVNNKDLRPHARPPCKPRISDVGFPIRSIRSNKFLGYAPAPVERLKTPTRVPGAVPGCKPRSIVDGHSDPASNSVTDPALILSGLMSLTECRARPDREGSR
jgi:hypothetical protein